MASSKMAMVRPMNRAAVSIRDSHGIYGARRQLYTKSCRPSVTSTSHVSLPFPQKRCITQQYLQRTKESEEEWSRWAEDIEKGKRKGFVQHLEDRGLLHQVVGERAHLEKLLTQKRVGFYVGVDPTAPSLHVGHMIPFMVLAWAFHWGYPISFVLGGATAKFGDPTGRTEERAREHRSVRTTNMAAMHMQLKKLSACIERYGFRHGYAEQWAARRALWNNSTWWNKVLFADVLRDLGVNMRLGPMLGRDTVKNRLEGKGMSFAEFCYPIMQAWDWFHLYRTGTQIQVGGADQFGNILFGMEAVKQMGRNTALQEDRRDMDDDLQQPNGFTTPLLTSPSGEKFGKSAGNAVWLDSDLTPVFDLYAYFVRTPDDQVERYLKMLTFLPLEEIAKIMEQQRLDPPSRVAHHTLAQEFVEITYGRDTAQKTALQHQQLFRPRSSTAQPTPPPTTGPSMPETYAHKPEAKFMNRAAGNIHAPPVTYESMSSGTVQLPRPLVLEQTLNKVLYNAGLVSSYSEGHRLIANKGAHIGSRAGDSGAMNDALSFTPIHPWVKERTPDFLIDEKLLIFKIGKWRMKMVELIDEAEFEAKGLTAPGWEEFKERRAGGKSEYEDMPQSDFKIRKIDHTKRKEDKE